MASYVLPIITKTLKTSKVAESTRSRCILRFHVILRYISEGNINAIKAANFTIYGKDITPTRLNAIEVHINEAGTASAIEADKIASALITTVQTSVANPAYLTNLVYSFTKKIMSTVQ